ncbi:alpha/beta hydrolase-fold protein [Stigmatella sp. ncwal1]|uniref:Alpha/beta hydrolase-fold protein n=1 Tax=Stigmatella ashevillensis TaxID=2995309 RepID=A0ABT5D426_9BACT|nr:alpha/beta hydrolase-fold protein [Stigmatella ashevillena]MDC0708412.1 alpha/beta hydrolase-fold protein [Stigmatella ashevillena]
MGPLPRSRLPFLLLLALTAVVGCDSSSPPPPPVEQTASDVQFDVTVPPETPVDAVLLLQGADPGFSGPSGQGLELVYQGGRVFSIKTRLPKNQELTYSVRMSAPTAQVALDALGQAVPARTVTLRENEENVGFSVERWGPPSGITQPQTVFVVAVPENTSPDDSLYLPGNQPELGPWDPAKAKFYKAVNSSYALTLSFAPGTSLEFKVTRGSWETVERNAEGGDIDNRTFRTGGGFERVAITVVRWEARPPPPPVLTGNIVYLDVTPTNSALEPRKVIIWLPPDYKDNSTRRYPVLYMHDGQNLMDASTSFAGEWGVDETAQRLVQEGLVEPLIIVGVYNTEDRIAEYTHVPDPPKYEQGGLADAYGQFLVEQLKPQIDSTYRTKPEGAYTGLAGSSLGGLVSLYLGMKYPNTFTRLGVVSPSVWWADQDIVTRVNALPAKLPLRIWEDIGTEEGDSTQEETETVEDAQALRAALVGKGWVEGTDLKYTVIEGGRHNEKDWAARFDDILQFLYPEPPLTP